MPHFGHHQHSMPLLMVCFINRRMRKLTKGDWEGTYPGTNVMWMLYLAELLLSSDKPIPGICRTGQQHHQCVREGAGASAAAGHQQLNYTLFQCCRTRSSM
eukprot:GHUV01039684.1.p2 GENE.GHUV01039684.1~~GHUV01039684.1.p2  ORF type:complete len:101 (+),score=24.70 GHUV01039684.1:587-889(+)